VIEPNIRDPVRLPWASISTTALSGKNQRTPYLLWLVFVLIMRALEI
jgi:hypothetical protein